MREVQLMYEIQALLVTGTLSLGWGLEARLSPGAEWRVAGLQAMLHGADEHGLFSCKLSAEACKAQLDRHWSNLPDAHVEYFVTETEVPANYQPKGK